MITAYMGTVSRTLTLLLLVATLLLTPTCDKLTTTCNQPASATAAPASDDKGATKQAPSGCPQEPGLSLSDPEKLTPEERAKAKNPEISSKYSQPVTQLEQARKKALGLAEGQPLVLVEIFGSGSGDAYRSWVAHRYELHTNPTTRTFCGISFMQVGHDRWSLVSLGDNWTLSVTPYIPPANPPGKIILRVEPPCPRPEESNNKGKVKVGNKGDAKAKDD